MRTKKEKELAALELEEADREVQVESERALIANLLDDPIRAIPVAERHGITGAMFIDAARGDVIDAIMSKFAAGEGIDAVTVAEHLIAAEKTEALRELEKSLAAINAPANIEAHCRNVLHRFMRSRLTEIGDTLADTASKPSAKPLDLAAVAVNDLSRMLLADRGERSAGEEVESIVREWTDLADGKRERRGCPLPTYEIGKLFGGRLEPGLHILAAKTSAGKSTLEAAIVRNVALRGGHVLRSFHDMPRRDLLQRDLAALCFIDIGRMKRGEMLPDERAILPLAVEAWKKGIGVETLTVPPLPEIVARMRAIHASRGLDLVTVDFVQQVKTGNAKIDAGGSANTIIGEVTKTLKNAALDLGVPVLLLSQLNRNEKDEYKMPVLTDLRDSGNIEQDARTVTFLSPDCVAEIWAREQKVDSWRKLDTRPINLNIAKNQQGGLGTVPLRMTCSAFSVEDTGRNSDKQKTPRWACSAGSRNGDPVPVVARDTDGHVGGFEPRFLALVNDAAKRAGKPVFEVVATVEDGLAQVAARVAEWRKRK